MILNPWPKLARRRLAFRAGVARSSLPEPAGAVVVVRTRLSLLPLPVSGRSSETDRCISPVLFFVGFLTPGTHVFYLFLIVLLFGFHGIYIYVHVPMCASVYTVYPRYLCVKASKG